MRTDIADNLKQLQERLGPDLASVLESDSSEEFVSPSLDRGLSLTQITGLDAGGSFPLSVGSYRFGHSAGASGLGQGQPTVPRFGLAITNDGAITITPTPEGLLVDGRHVVKPTVISDGQIVNVAGASFVVASATPSLLRRVEECSAEPLPAMPEPGKGRGADDAIVAWAKTGHAQALQASRGARLGPAEISRRSIAGPTSFHNLGPNTPGFGRVPIGLVSGPYVVPGDLSKLNSATQKKLSNLASIPAAPLEIDLLSQSLAVVGPRAAARTVVSWVALCVATMSRPDAVGLRTMARGSRNEWSWVDSLPNAENLPDSPLNLLIVDEGDAPMDAPAQGAIVAIESGHPIPESIDLVMELGSVAATVTDRSTGKVIEGVSPIGVSSVFALGVTFQMREHSIGGSSTNDWNAP